MKRINFLAGFLLPEASKINVFLLLLGVLLVNTMIAQEKKLPVEKKVDYLERIYFSGENKEGLNTKILISLQEFQDLTPNPCLAKQLTFLLDIKEKANTADNACDVLDLLAVGIYNIDAAEASRQGVRVPSEKAKVRSADAVESLNKLSGTSTNLSTTATNLQWSNYLLNGNNYSSFASSAGKVARTAGTVGAVAGTAGQAGQTVKDIGEIGKSFGIGLKKKDKACDGVTRKDIEIGEHLAPGGSAPGGATSAATATVAVTTTVVSIAGVTSAALRAMTDTLRSKSGVQSAEKAFDEAQSTITVMHAGKTSDLADWFEDKMGSKYKLVNYSDGKISLAAKTK